MPYLQYTVASPPALTGTVFTRRYRLFLGQCVLQSVDA